jgi:asparagine synthase (glutamine-hydrolysing)
MCGIVGHVDFNSIAEVDTIRYMCNLLSQRGPDGEGIYMHKNVGMGHRRLSIIDLETGDQPMISGDGGIVLVFNGEIYNYRDLKSELQKIGGQFTTKSDTEVIIEGYRLWGLDRLLEQIEGMFAFSLYDQSREEVFIVRDKFGEKPLYYIHNRNGFTFASELKALVNFLPERKLNYDALNLYLSLTYIPAPYTIYQNLNKLEAGHYFHIKIGGSVVKNKYYDLIDSIKSKKSIKDIDEGSQQLRDLLFDSIRHRMISDVPLGAFLSGGIDSSIVTAVMSKLSFNPVHTFSIGFAEKEYDESDRAQLVANHIQSRHTNHVIDYANVVKEIDPIIHYLDEPFGDSSAIPSHYVAQLARKDVTVVLTGDAADELFAGYEKYLVQQYVRQYKRYPRFIRSIFRSIVYKIPHNRLTNSILRRIKKVIQASELDGFDMHLSLMQLGFNEKERSELLHEQLVRDIKPFIKKYYDVYPEKDTLEQQLYTDLNIVLEGDMLVKVDRMCMKNSLEARVPFLDSRIVELSYAMESQLKLKGKDKKHILKKAFGDLLPAETLGFRKKGFGVPVDYWLKNELRPELDRLLSRRFIEAQGIFSYNVVDRLVKDHIGGKENHKGKLWNLFVFQKWYEKNMLPQTQSI